jgi:hypothetical protein
VRYIYRDVLGWLVIKLGHWLLQCVVDSGHWLLQCVVDLERLLPGYGASLLTVKGEQWGRSGFLPFTVSLLFQGLIPLGRSGCGSAANMRRVGTVRMAAIMRTVVVYDIMVLFEDVFYLVNVSDALYIFLVVYP